MRLITFIVVALGFFHVYADDLQVKKKITDGHNEYEAIEKSCKVTLSFYIRKHETARLNKSCGILEADSIAAIDAILAKITTDFPRLPFESIMLGFPDRADGYNDNRKWSSSDLFSHRLVAALLKTKWWNKKNGKSEGTDPNALMTNLLNEKHILSELTKVFEKHSLKLAASSYENPKMSAVSAMPFAQELLSSGAKPSDKFIYDMALWLKVENTK